MNNETIGEQRERIAGELDWRINIAKSFVIDMAEQLGLTLFGGTCKDCKWWDKKMICNRVKVKGKGKARIGYTANATIVIDLYTDATFACNQWESKDES